MPDWLRAAFIKIILKSFPPKLLFLFTKLLVSTAIHALRLSELMKILWSSLS